MVQQKCLLVNRFIRILQQFIFWNRFDSRGYVDLTKWQPTYHLYLKPARL
jgi:hypothetical protein